jgi:DNA (cytosine-5)-methyltransferase 1
LKSFDLFSGGGGLSLGAERAGVEPLALIEIDEAACRTLRGNRPEWNVINESIVTACKKGLLSYLKDKAEPVDIVIGGFPMSGIFSFK